jgi:hypothetical protein
MNCSLGHARELSVIVLRIKKQSKYKPSNGTIRNVSTLYTLQLIQSWEREMLSTNTFKAKTAAFLFQERDISQIIYRSSENIWCHKQNKRLKTITDLYVKWRQNIILRPWGVYKKAT